MCGHIAKHLAVNSILTNEIDGFRSNLSTVALLINTVTALINTLKNKGQADVILLDFSKAYDKNIRKRLSSKLT